MTSLAIPLSLLALIFSTSSLFDYSSSQAHTVFNAMLGTSLLPITDLLSRIEIGIINLIKTHPQPTLISFALMFDHDGISYVRTIEAKRGVLCAREVFPGADIYDDLLDRATTEAVAGSTKHSTIRNSAIDNIQRDFGQLLLIQPKLKGFFAFEKSASSKLYFTSKGVSLEEFKRCVVKAVILRINYRYFLPSVHTLLRTSPSALLAHFDRNTAMVTDFVLNSLPGVSVSQDIYKKFGIADSPRNRAKCGARQEEIFEACKRSEEGLPRPAFSKAISGSALPRQERRILFSQTRFVSVKFFSSDELHFLCRHFLLY